MYKITKERPLSWSAISSFEYSPDQWYKRYILKEQDTPSTEMIFGKTMGERFASDATFVPNLQRRAIFEYELNAVMDGIPLIGFIDSYTEHTHLEEYKTGRKPWDQKRADKHGQIDMYLLMLHLMHKVRPENVQCTIHWMPTSYNDRFKYNFTVPDFPEVISFETKRTMTDILKFRTRILDTYKKMQEHVANA
jgi:RecB family exonuclease